MFNLSGMPVKFFSKDVVGRQPKKTGDKFVAFFMTGNHTFVVDEIRGGVIMAHMED